MWHYFSPKWVPPWCVHVGMYVFEPMIHACLKVCVYVSVNGVNVCKKMSVWIYMCVNDCVWKYEHVWAYLSVDVCVNVWECVWEDVSESCVSAQGRVSGFEMRPQVLGQSLRFQCWASPGWTHPHGPVQSSLSGYCPTPEELAWWCQTCPHRAWCRLWNQCWPRTHPQSSGWCGNGSLEGPRKRRKGGEGVTTGWVNSNSLRRVVSSEVESPASSGDKFPLTFFYSSWSN